MRKQTIRFLDKINLVKWICTHLISKNHTKEHRMVVGLFVIGIGVCLAKYTARNPHISVQVVGDSIGYLIHAIGSIPYIDYIIGGFEEEV